MIQTCYIQTIQTSKKQNISQWSVYLYKLFSSQTKQNKYKNHNIRNPANLFSGGIRAPYQI